MKIIYTSLFALSLCFTPQLASQADAFAVINEIENQQITFAQSGNALTVFGATGKTVYIYNLIGVQIRTVYVDSPEKRIDLNGLPHGIYPIKVGNVTRKIRL